MKSNVWFGNRLDCNKVYAITFNYNNILNILTTKLNQLWEKLGFNNIDMRYKGLYVICTECGCYVGTWLLIALFRRVGQTTRTNIKEEGTKEAQEETKVCKGKKIKIKLII